MYLIKSPVSVYILYRSCSVTNPACKPLKYLLIVVLTSYLSLDSDGQSVTIGALGGGHFLNVPVWFKYKLLGHRLVVGVPQAQTAIAALPTCFH